MRSVVLDVTPEKVFAFCTTRAGFLAHFPDPVRQYRGAEQWEIGSEFWVDYRHLGLPMSWHGKITELEPNRYFKDEMVSGLFRRWEHTHTVEPTSGGTKYTDTVQFSLGWGSLIDRFMVKPMLDTFFRRRHVLLRAALGARA